MNENEHAEELKQIFTRRALPFFLSVLITLELVIIFVFLNEKYTYFLKIVNLSSIIGNSVKLALDYGMTRIKNVWKKCAGTLKTALVLQIISLCGGLIFYAILYLFTDTSDQDIGFGKLHQIND